LEIFFLDVCANQAGKPKVTVQNDFMLVPTSHIKVTRRLGPCHYSLDQVEGISYDSLDGLLQDQEISNNNNKISKYSS
jgi:hypothetical protein